MLDATPERDNHTPCLTPGCNKPHRTRGLCSQCYADASAMIRRGEMTWGKLIDLGLALASNREHSSRRLFREAVKARMKGQTPPIGPQGMSDMSRPEASSSN